MKKFYGIIYKVENKVNGKVYIGQTIRTFKERYLNNIEKYTHSDHLRRGMKKDGIESFNIVEKFDVAYSREELNNKEKKYIKEYKCYMPNFGYNKTYGGECGIPTEETKEKMKKSHEKYKTAIVKLDLEFNWVKRYDGAVDTEIDGFDKAIVTAATKTKATVNRFYFITEEEYSNLIYNKEELLRFRCKLAGKKYGGVVMVDEKLNILKDTLDLKSDGYNCTELKKRAKISNVVFGEDFFFATLEDVLNKKVRPNYGTTFYAISKDREIVKEYSRVTDVFFDGLSKARVSACLNKVRKQYVDLVWIYKNEYIYGN